MADRPTQPPRPDESQIAEEAARWLEVHKTADEEQRRQFVAWLRRSARHVHYFLHTTALDVVLNDVDARREFDIQALVREARQNVTPFGTAGAARAHAVTPLSHERTSRGRFALRAAAAIAALTVTTWLTVQFSRDQQEFITRTGEQRAVQLQDGSIVHLNTNSRLHVRMTDLARELRLLEGEALFIVHRDAHRAFNVHVNDTVIQAIGTQFNVRRRGQDIKVSVLEGRVRILAGSPDIPTASAPAPAAPSFDAGEEAEIERDGEVQRRQVADISEVTTWRQRRLVFRSDPLSEVVAEFNRYNHSPKIRLEGLEGSDRHYTGTFDADDPEAFAVVLAEQKSLQVERGGTEIVIRAKQADTAP